jgi:hypothetical protein
MEVDEGFRVIVNKLYPCAKSGQFPAITDQCYWNTAVFIHLHADCDCFGTKMAELRS